MAAIVCEPSPCDEASFTCCEREAASKCSFQHRMPTSATPPPTKLSPDVHCARVTASRSSSAVAPLLPGESRVLAFSGYPLYFTGPNSTIIEELVVKVIADAEGDNKEENENNNENNNKWYDNIYLCNLKQEKGNIICYKFKEYNYLNRFIQDTNNTQ